VLLQLHIVRDLALAREALDLVLSPIPLFYIVGLADAQGAAGVDEGGVCITNVGREDAIR
jgi:hypothetical protein